MLLYFKILSTIIMLWCPKLTTVLGFTHNSRRNFFHFPRSHRTSHHNKRSTLQMSHKTKPVIAVDIDETIAPLFPHLIEFYSEQTETIIDKNSFLASEFKQTFGGTDEACAQVVTDFFFSKYAQDILPYPGAYEVLSHLKLDFDLHIVTARDHDYDVVTTTFINTYFPNIFTEIHFGNHYSMNGVSRSKSAICQEINAILLIDDNIDYVIECMNKGIHAILFGDYTWYQPQYYQHFNNGNTDILSQNTTNNTITTTPTTTTTSSDNHNTVSNNIIRCYSWKETYNTIYNICKTYHISVNSDHFQMAAIQMCSTNNKQKNLDTSIYMIEQAVNKGAHLISLPECSVYMGEKALDILYASEDIATSTYLQSLCQLTRKHSIWLSIGGFPEKANNHIYKDSHRHPVHRLTNSNDTNSSSSSSSSNSNSSIGTTSSNVVSSSSSNDSEILTSSSSDNIQPIESDSSNNSNYLTKVYNTHIIINPVGDIVLPVYRKIHLFDCPLVGLCESNTTAPGSEICIINIGRIKLGLTICYDLRFPELFSALTYPDIHMSRQDPNNDDNSNDVNNQNVDKSSDGNTVEMTIDQISTSSSVTLTTTISTGNMGSTITGSSNSINTFTSFNQKTTSLPSSIQLHSTLSTCTPEGADIILVPAAFTMITGQAHWDILLKARAIENQVYIVAAAQSGRHNDRRESYGHSIIIDPWGTVVSECSIHSSKKLATGTNSPTTIDSSSFDHDNGNSNNIENDSSLHDVYEGIGEIIYGIYNYDYHQSIRNKMPIQNHRRFQSQWKIK